MYLTGFADEAATDIEGQIRATKELGWTHIESRNIDGVNIHNLSDAQFDIVYGKLQDAGIQINCFGSTVANWSKKISDPFEISLEESKRAIPRMQRLGTKLIRIMSYAVIESNPPDQQEEEERFRRLRILQKMFADAGMTMVHENCMNYGGMGWPFTMKMIEHVPGLKLVFDTGNPVFNPDRTGKQPWPRQSSWEFYSKVKEHIAYIHIKDAIWGGDDNVTYTYPGEGQGDVRQILTDLLKGGYDGGISIEPHMVVVFHEDAGESPAEDMYRSYVEYGKRLMRILDQIAP
ncbi:MAG: sugar phosphate isomerase/epimerase [bacterium]